MLTLLDKNLLITIHILFKCYVLTRMFQVVTCIMNTENRSYIKTVLKWDIMFRAGYRICMLNLELKNKIEQLINYFKVCVLHFKPQCVVLRMWNTSCFNQMHYILLNIITYVTIFGNSCRN